MPSISPPPPTVIGVRKYLALRRALITAGYSHEIDWSEGLKPVADSKTFFEEFAWVVLNSGMRNQVARTIWERVRPHVEAGGSAHDKFRHIGKCDAIDHVWKHRDKLFADYLSAADKVEFLRGLPWIGKITCWHLAKNYGHDCAKPDRHLVRLAGSIEAVAPLCLRLARATGDRIATVDLVIWRAANLGMV